MKKLKGYEIRQLWLDFFQSKGHAVIPSAPLVPHDDPTLLWINAGVAPLKKYFDGREKPTNPRMVNAQKSIRTNDIDNVGRTSRHHTFFEMLGNFSIGDYFRDEVIPWAAELLFDEKWFGFPKEKIYITYYPDDVETFKKWIENGVLESHLIPLPGNFWEIGEGPCGPDTEIFFDRGEKYDPENIGIKLLKEDLDNERYIEIWNIVFSQFNSVTNLSRDEYPELPSKNIDTGSGLERLACIFQETETNYETDLFLPLINFVENYTGKKYEGDNKMAFRVIADHVRSVTFAVADGAMISNEGRGYVLRRILRRAVRYGKKLGIAEPFLYKMVSIVVENMKQFYGYLQDKQAIVEKIIKTEEENFLRTLETGEKKLNDIITVNKKNGLDTISGKDAFLLYDTFGFPIELTEEISNEANFKVDLESFKEELNAQKARARAARSDMQSMNTQNEAYLNFKSESTFVGYTDIKSVSKVIGIFADNKLVESATSNVVVVFDKTPFYAEMGGQVGDKGIVIINNNPVEVLNTFKLPNGQHAHIINLGEHNLSLNDEVELIVDEQFRNNVCSNHSATHLLNQSLRVVLGDHVVQQGSLVSDERLRFDFNHYNNLTNEEILSIENIVNEQINKAIPVITKEVAKEEAIKSGAQAAFGEKYGDVVRVVDMDFSKELCGGTHVENTSDIVKFAVLSIESKGSGIFRIEALTGENVANGMSEHLNNIKEEITLFISKAREVVAKAKADNFELEMPNITIPAIMGSYKDIINYRNALEEARKLVKELEKAYDNMFRSKNSSSYKAYLDEVETINGISVLVKRVDNVNNDVLKDIIDKVSAELGKCVIFFADVMNNEKIIFVAKSKENAANCGMLVKNAAIITGGNGGGRPDFAQAGGKDVSKLDEALQTIKGMIK
ncbi:MAG: alanine--tRNA ligase [Bacilli bacterium]|nr:alanine--tRNA ligase [Bacilli bacterium]